jgi:nucleotide-binding universal stress UspA family protein
MALNKILIAVDESTESMKAAKLGFELAHQVKATLGVLYVVDKTREVVNPDLGITLGDSRAALLKQVQNTIEQFLQLYAGMGEVFQFTPEGEPGKEIVKLAAEWQADLIVMGMHAHGKIDLLLFNSVAEYVIRHAAVPVLVAPPNMP